ncbi:glycosyl hydrolases family 18-domain-containing protein [Mycena haematopus]|nr:glycosyl hydrolases family 18-domain-containing protein [Mycena haematopus]
MAASPLKRLLVLLQLTALTFLNAAHATPTMQRPSNASAPPRAFKTEAHPIVHEIHKRAAGKVSIGYFTNWGIYGANFQPTDIVPSTLTHILYAFADVDPSSGTISLTDLYADTQKHFPTDSWSDTGNNLYGCLKQLYLLKLANRNLKVSLSIGGWTYSQDGHFAFVTNAAARATFVTDAVAMIENYGFDGIDLDFEYPASTAQGQGFADLFTELRTAFDALAAKKGDSTTYQLSAAVSAGAANYANLVVPQMNAALTFWNLMAYDYAGSWLTYSDNQANLYGGARTGVSTDAAVKHFVSSGATVGKIVMGIPLYGHAFEDTAGLGQPYNGIGPGTIQAGIYSYNVLPLAGAQVFENTTDVSSYSYNSATEELVSYDTPNIVKLKAKYTNANGLAGSMFWDLSTDKVSADSLVGVSAGVLGALDTTLNHINFPNSEWDNIRSNMGTSTTTSSTGSPTGTPGGGTGICAGVAAWVATSIYTGGLKATYNGDLWTAQWWTQGDTPGGSAGVWVNDGAC